MHSDIEQQYFLENLYANQKKSAKAFPQREEKGRFNEIRKTINADSLWYAIYFPQFKNLNETQKKNYLSQLAAVSYTHLTLPTTPYV